MGLREEKRAELRRAIIDTATGMFRTNGYDETRVQEIAARVRVSEATFFNHFPTKQALLDHCTLEVVESYAALLRRELLADDRPAADRIREIIAVVGQRFAADRRLMAVVATRSNLFYGATGPVREHHLEAYELLAALLRQGQRRGEFRDDVDPRQLAEILTATYMLTIANWLVGWWKAAEDLEPRLARAVEVFLSGCLRRGESRPRAARRPARGTRRRTRR